MTRPLRVVTTGLAVSYPFGGVFWDYLQYPLGLRRLGHEVLYVEDTGKWCYDPGAGTFVPGGAANAAAFARHVAAFAPELADRWAYRDATGAAFGLPRAAVAAFCRGADLLVNISGALNRTRDEYHWPHRAAFIDSDPVYTQAALLRGPPAEHLVRLDRWARQYQVVFSFGEGVGAPDCTVPTGPLRWVPTRQPVVLDRFGPAARPAHARRRVLTTVASWEPAEKGPVVGGVAYGGKNREWERFLDLPGRSALPLEVAMSGPAPVERLRAAGWRVRDGYEVSADPGTYRAYLADSAGEWSVAKNAYAATRSGWFSCRTACYLALGVPAVVQDTGFSRWLPTGEGLFAFSTMEEAADAIARLAREPDRHAAAARAVAAECFDSDMVLTRLLAAALG
jgi:hypothetical protein